MTELILRINNPIELEQLLPILNQLHIRYYSRSTKPTKKSATKKEAVLAKIRSGALDMPNLNSFMQDFENCRQDRF